MGLHRVIADHQVFGDLTGGQAGRNQAQHFLFPLGQCGDRRLLYTQSGFDHRHQIVQTTPFGHKGIGSRSSTGQSHFVGVV